MCSDPQHSRKSHFTCIKNSLDLEADARNYEDLDQPPWFCGAETYRRPKEKACKRPISAL